MIKAITGGTIQDLRERIEEINAMPESRAKAFLAMQTPQTREALQQIAQTATGGWVEVAHIYPQILNWVMKEQTISQQIPLLIGIALNIRAVGLNVILSPTMFERRETCRSTVE